MRKISILLLIIVLSMFAGGSQGNAQHDTSKDDAITHFNKGNKFYSAGKYSEAIGQFKKALEHNPKDASSHFGLGNSYFLKKDYKKALSHYKEVIKLKPEYAKVHYAMGLAYRRLGRKEEAEREFEKYNRLSRKKVEGRSTAKKAAKEKPKARKEGPPKVSRIEKKPSGAPERELAGRPRAADREIAGRPRAERGELESRPHVKRVAPPPKKKVAKEPVEKKARPRIVRKKEPEKEKAKRKVVKKKKVEKKRENGNFITRSTRDLWNSSPAGRIFLSLIAYTLVAQAWLGLVVVVCLIFLWRKR
ncbi:MAG: tetratricopeptide repeat protein [Candidatus Brocadiales bacterium]